jgi:hypothetical protein
MKAHLPHKSEARLRMTSGRVGCASPDPFNFFKMNEQPVSEMTKSSRLGAANEDINHSAKPESEEG